MSNGIEQGGGITPSNYPPEFREKVAERLKQPLGELFGIRNFGVNLTRLSPSAASALRHTHSLQDEFIFVLEGYPTLITDAGADVVYLEIGDRSPGDSATYPDDDIQAHLGADSCQ